MRQKLINFTIFIILLTAINGCGVKGPLYYDNSQDDDSSQIIK